MKKLLIVLLALIMVISLAACGENDNDTQEGENATSEQGDSVPDNKENSDDDYTFDIKEDDHTVVITIANTIQVYTHDGVNVTGYTTYADCGDAETAKTVASSINLNDSYYAGMGIKSVQAKGKYVVQEYTEEGFPCTTYEELHSLAEQYKQIQQ